MPTAAAPCSVSRLIGLALLSLLVALAAAACGSAADVSAH